MAQVLALLSVRNMLKVGRHQGSLTWQEREHQALKFYLQSQLALRGLTPVQTLTLPVTWIGQNLASHCRRHIALSRQVVAQSCKIMFDLASQMGCCPAISKCP